MATETPELLETKTQRGFDRIEFEDFDGHKCHLQKSSLATEDCLRLGHSEMGVIHLVPGEGWKPLDLPPQTQCNTTMHLSRDQVDALLPYLMDFVINGELITEFTEADHEEVKGVLKNALTTAEEMQRLTADLKAAKDKIERYERERKVYVQCPSVLPDPRFPVRCTLKAGHGGNKHGGGGCEWNKDDVRDTDAGRR